MRVAAGIVTYNPDIDRFRQCINSIVSQCCFVIVYDNSSDNIKEIISVIDELNDYVLLIKGEENKGIAFAINRIIEKADELNCDWLITLDHDSICPDNMVSEYDKYFSVTNVAALCPKVIDRETINEKYSSDLTEGITEVTNCIQSGTAYNINICKSLGMFYEWYFIDYVDFDYCTCLTLNHYKIFRVNTVTLDHKLGEKSKTKYAIIGEKLYNKTKFKPFLYLTYKTHFSEFRMYYQFRNNIVYIKRFRKYYGSFIPYCKVVTKALKRIIRSDCRLSTLKGILRGVKDGCKYHPDTYFINRGE